MEGLWLQQLVVFLVTAGFVIPLGKRFNVNPVLGFIVVGALVGPNGLGRFADAFPWLGFAVIRNVEAVRQLAELGIVFLLFMLGLNLSVDRLLSMRRLVFGMGSLQIVATAIPIATIAYAFGNPPAAAVILGSCLALSSTAIVGQLLIEQGRFGTSAGRATFAVLLAQDLAVVPVLFMLEVLGGHERGSPLLGFALSLVEATVAIVVIYGIGRMLLRPLYRLVAGSGPELFVAATLLVIIATAAATHAVGLSAALGAFLVGLLLAETEYRHEIEANIEPFRGLLLGLFFMSVGMIIDLTHPNHQPLLIAVSIVGLILVKAPIAALLARAFGLRSGPAAEVGLMLAQGGEFAFIVVALAVSQGLLPRATAQFMLIVAVGTMLLTPLLASAGRHLGRRLGAAGTAGAEAEGAVDTDMEGHVVIVGYGRTGRLLAEVLDRQQIAHVALDLDAARVSDLRRRGAPVYFGDASRAAMLSRVRLEHAAALIVSMDDALAAERVLQAARRLRANLPILARARDLVHAARLKALGATVVVPEVLESGLQLGEQLLQQIGLPAESARQVIDEQRLFLETER